MMVALARPCGVDGSNARPFRGCAVDLQRARRSIGKMGGDDPARIVSACQTTRAAAPTTSARKRSRARLRRDITVPMGTSSLWAASL